MEATTTHLRDPARRAAGRLHPKLHPHLTPVYALAEDCLYEVGHAHQVTRLALLIFDQLRPVHGLGPKRRFRLAAASLLHDIGQLEGPRGHHKTSLRYILDSPLLGWSQRQRLVVGSIARYHRKSPPKRSHSHFVALNETDRRDVRILAGILRIADGLDNSHRSVVRDLHCSFDANQITIRCIARRSGGGEQERAVDKAQVLADALRRDIYIVWDPA